MLESGRIESSGKFCVSPEVHVSVQPVGDDIGAGASGAAAHYQDDHGLDGQHLEGQREGEGCEGHDAELAQEADEDAPGPADVCPKLGRVHRAAHGEHDHGQHDGEDGAHDQAQDSVEVALRDQAWRPGADGGIGMADWRWSRHGR